MCPGVAETAPELAGSDGRLKLDVHTNMRPKHQAEADCKVGDKFKTSRDWESESPRTMSCTNVPLRLFHMPFFDPNYRSYPCSPCCLAWIDDHSAQTGSIVEARLPGHMGM